MCIICAFRWLWKWVMTVHLVVNSYRYKIDLITTRPDLKFRYLLLTWFQRQSNQVKVPLECAWNITQITTHKWMVLCDYFIPFYCFLCCVGAIQNVCLYVQQLAATRNIWDIGWGILLHYSPRSVLAQFPGHRATARSSIEPHNDRILLWVVFRLHKPGNNSISRTKRMLHT